MNSLLSAIKAFVLKNRTAYKDYLGNGKYDVKKLPEECVPDSVINNIRKVQNKADSAYDEASLAYDEASSAYSKANLAYDKASDVNSRLFALTNLNYNFKTFEHTVAKEQNIRTEITDTNGISDIPLAESTAPMKCHFNIVLNDSSNNRIGGYTVFDGKIVRGITKISETYRLFIDERVKLGSDGYAELKIGYRLNSNDNLWRKDIGVVISLPSTDIDNSNISTVFIEAYGDLVDVDNYAPWPSICVPLAGTNDAGVVYASDKTDDQTVPVSIDKNGYLWCKGSETTIPDYNQNDPTASDYIKNRPFYTGEVVQTDIIPEQTYTLSSAGRFNVYADESGTYPYSLEEGKDYTVVYNGTTYELTSINYRGQIYVGDIDSLLGQESTFPFAIFASSGILQIVDYIGNTDVTLKISANVQEIKQIDTKYIPELPEYMSKVNPVCNGSFSLNRKAGTTIGEKSHTEGNETTASATSSHAEGYGTAASGAYSHAEGTDTTASGTGSHAEGTDTNAPGSYSHAEGDGATAYGYCSHAEGYYTKASGDYSHVQGKYNIDDSDEKYANIVGNGKSDTARSNAHTLDWEGNAWYAGTVEGTAIIVKSSTPDSTKKFKITVDDTGTISATEVT